MKVLVAGVGNLFLGDDGFGVEVARRLGEHSWGGAVRVVDFGTRGFDLTRALLEGYDLVMIADAVRRGAKPGTLFVLDLSSGAQENSEGNLSLGHAPGVEAAIELARRMQGTWGRILLVGCEAENCEFGENAFGMSAPVSGAVDDAIRIIERIIQEALETTAHA